MGGTDRYALARRDARYLRAMIRHGSKSFYAALWLLPRRLRGPVTTLYAFCRSGDDAVDGTPSPPTGLRRLERRLERVYAGQPVDDPIERAFTELVERYQIPRKIPEALLEGFRWDVEGRRYETVEELHEYGARVASTVGIMMTLLMGRREPEVLARACDLGVAMQLTNIARDVGEDGRAGRLYLPLQWLAEVDIDPERWLANPVFSPELGRVVARILDEADQLYQRADRGIVMLPRDCQPAIRAARLIYSDIGRVLKRSNMDSVNGRAVTSSWRKLCLLIRAHFQSQENKQIDATMPLMAASLWSWGVGDGASYTWHDAVVRSRSGNGRDGENHR